VRARRLAARWVLPVEGPPIEHGAVLIGQDGRIQALGSDSEVPRPDVPSLTFQHAVILPGLINTHTHLELTGFEGQIAELEFPAWIRSLRQLKATRKVEDYLDAARRGLQDCFALGITTVADTGDSGAVIQALAEADGSGIAYQEVFGPHPSQLDESLADLQERVRERSRWAGGRVRLGVSPHALYSVSGPLFAAVAEWARAEGFPVAVHVAESAAETHFLLAGSGPFATAWQERGIPLPPAGRTPVAWLHQLGMLTERTLCIHAIQVLPPDIELLAAAGAAVAHCPLSNRAHGHGAAPLRDFLTAGIRVGLGTDSVVSIGRLDLLAEARAARSLASLSADQALELCTLSAARALGMESEAGSLRPGKWGDCAVIRISESEASPAEAVLASTPDHVLFTCIGGRDVFHAP